MPSGDLHSLKKKAKARPCLRPKQTMLLNAWRYRWLARVAPGREKIDWQDRSKFGYRLVRTIFIFCCPSSAGPNEDQCSQMVYTSHANEKEHQVRYM